MLWDKQEIGKYPRLTDESDKAVKVRTLAAKAYRIHSSAERQWTELNPQMRDYWCEITAAVLAAMGETKQ